MRSTTATAAQRILLSPSIIDETVSIPRISIMNNAAQGQKPSKEINLLLKLRFITTTGLSVATLLPILSFILSSNIYNSIDIFYHTREGLSILEIKNVNFHNVFSFFYPLTVFLPLKSLFDILFMHIQKELIPTSINAITV